MLACFSPKTVDDDEVSYATLASPSPASSRRSSRRSSNSSIASSRRTSMQGQGTGRQSQVDLQLRAMLQAGKQASSIPPASSRRRSSQDSSCFSDHSAFGSPPKETGRKGSRLFEKKSTRRRSSNDSIRSSGSRRSSTGSRLQVEPFNNSPAEPSNLRQALEGQDPCLGIASPECTAAAPDISASPELQQPPTPPQVAESPLRQQTAAPQADEAAAAAAAAAIVAREPLFGHARYRKLRSINRGSHGFVQLAVDLRTGDQVAVKFIKRGSSMQAKSILRELMNQRLCLQHPHIVGLREVFLTPNHLGIAMEYANGGDLSDYIADHVNSKGVSVPEEEARRIFQQLVVAVHYCHRLGIANRDIKLDNVLLHNKFDGQATVKLCDFGYSRSGASECATACGTPEYMAPEVMAERVYDGKKVDVWSCGCTLFVMLAGVFPFLKMTEEGLPPTARLRKMYPRIHAGITNPIPKVPAQARDLLQRMLTPDPANRITMDEVLAHPWVAHEMPKPLADLNDDILASFPRTVAQPGIRAAMQRRDAALGSQNPNFKNPKAGGCCGQTEEQLVAIVEACVAGKHDIGNLMSIR